MNYKTLFTTYGLQRIADAQATGAVIKLTSMAVGDGGGNPYTPTAEQTSLVRELYRHALNRVFHEDPQSLSRFTAELIVPAAVAGFTAREVGLYDDTGALFAVANIPETYKPTAAEGAFSDMTVRLQFVVANAGVIALQVDPNVAVATHAWVLSSVTPAVLFPGGTTGQLLRKKSNANGDTEWADPTKVNVTVDCIEETQTLAANQTTVILQAVTTTGLAVYVNGARLRLDQWTKDATFPLTRLVLGQSYAAGTKIVCAQNEPNSGLDLTAYVKKAGDTMTGPLGIGTAPQAPLHVIGQAIVQQTAAGASDFADIRAVHGNSVARLSAYDASHTARGGTVWLNSSSAVPLILATKNLERMRITQEGVVSIGAPNPYPDAGLEVGTGPILIDMTTGNRVTGLVGAGGTTDAFTYDGDKRLAHYGLAWKAFTGTNESAAALTGYGGVRMFSAGIERLRMTQGGAFVFGSLNVGAISDGPGIMGVHKNSTAGGAWLEFVNRGTVSQDLTTYEVGGIYGRMYRDVLDPAYGAGISLLRLASNSGNSSAGTIVFKTDEAGVPKASLTERMRITGSGQVGIGTDDPRSTLNVTRPGSVNNNNLVRWTDATNSTGYLTIRNDNGPGVGVGSDGHLAFSTNQQGQNVFNEVARFGSNGALGIGTNNPQVAMHLASTLDEHIRIQRTNGFLAFYNTQNTQRLAYMQGAAGGLILGSDVGPIQLNGAVNHPTPAAGAAGTESVTAAWVRSLLSASVGSSGFQRLGPSGLILQWGYVVNGTFGARYGFPIQFPNMVLSLVGSDADGNQVFGSLGRDAAGFTLRANASTISFMYFAIGY